MTAFSIQLPRDVSASPRARRLVHQHLDDQLPAVTVDNVNLAVSELVANAVRHGEGTIELRLQVDGDLVRGEVIDEGTGFEYELREEGLDDVGGRGLFIVS